MKNKKRGKMKEVPKERIEKVAQRKKKNTDRD